MINIFQSPRTVPHPSGAQHEPADPQRICPRSGVRNTLVCYWVKGTLMTVCRHPYSGLPCDCQRLSVDIVAN